MFVGEKEKDEAAAKVRGRTEIKVRTLAKRF